MRQRLATLTRSRAGPVQNGLRSSVTKPRRRRRSAKFPTSIEEEFWCRVDGCGREREAARTSTRRYPRDAFDKRDRLPIQRSGIAREQSSDQPPQGNEGRKDKRDDTGEGDGKVKVMHDDQRLLQTRSGVQNLTLHRLPIRPHIGAAWAAGPADEVRPDIRQPDVICQVG